MAMPAMACQGCQAAPSNFPSFTSSCRCSACSCRRFLNWAPTDPTSAWKTPFRIVSWNWNALQSFKTTPDPSNFHNSQHVFPCFSKLEPWFCWTLKRWHSSSPGHDLHWPIYRWFTYDNRDFSWQTVKLSGGSLSNSKKHLRYWQ